MSVTFFGKLATIGHIIRTYYQVDLCFLLHRVRDYFSGEGAAVSHLLSYKCWIRS